MITFQKFKFGKSGLGNLLFQYAGVRMYAEKHGYTMAMPPWIGNSIFTHVPAWTLSDRVRSFFHTRIQLADMQSYTKKDAIRWLFSSSKHPLPHTHTISDLYDHPQDHIDLFGYLQDEFSLHLLKKNRDQIQTWFQFADSVQTHMKTLTQGKTPWVGLHIRKGDFSTLGIDLPISHYQEALATVQKEFPHHNVFIATNDQSVLTHFKDIPLLVIPYSHSTIPSYVMDFWMLRHADAIISGGSTFSWWAAFLNTKAHFYSAPLTHTWKRGELPRIIRTTLS